MITKIEENEGECTGGREVINEGARILIVDGEMQ